MTGLGLVCLTTVIQAFFMVTGIRLAERRVARHARGQDEIRKVVAVSLFTAWMFVGAVIEALVWAVVYHAIPAIGTLANLETARYFSLATFTTVGYGDVVLGGNWRMLSSIQAASGMIIIGWTTAVISRAERGEACPGGTSMPSNTQLWRGGPVQSPTAS